MEKPGNGNSGRVADILLGQTSPVIIRMLEKTPQKHLIEQLRSPLKGYEVTVILRNTGFTTAQKELIKSAVAEHNVTIKKR